MNSNWRTTIFQQNPLLRIVLPFILGIIIYDLSLPSIIDSMLYSSLFGAILVSILFHFLAEKKSALQGFSSIVSSLSIMLIGFGMSANYDVGSNKKHCEKLEEPQYLSIARVIEKPKALKNVYRVKVHIQRVIKSDEQYKLNVNAYLYIPKTNLEIPSKGATILLKKKWQRIRSKNKRYGMDYAQYSRRMNYYYQQYVDTSGFKILKQTTKTTFIERLQDYGIRQLTHYLKDPNTKALMLAMLLGDESLIDPETRTDYADTGIIHIVSISGAHIALLFAWVAFFFRKTNTKRSRLLKYATALCLIWFYVLLAGASTPALRAAILFSIMGLGVSFNKTANPINYLLSAALVLLLINPMYLFQIGFQLSFLAVLSIIIFYKPIQSCYQGKYKITNYIWNSIAMSIAAEILIAPLVAYYFHNFPPYFILANLIAGIAMSAILFLGFVLLVVAGLPIIAIGVSWLIMQISIPFHQFIDWLQRYSPQCFKSISISPLLLCLCYIFIASMLIAMFNKSKKALGFGLGILLSISILSSYTQWQQSKQEKLYVGYTDRQIWLCKIQGHSYQSIPKTFTKSTTFKEVLIAWGITDKSELPISNALQFKGKKIIVWDGNQTLPKEKFPIDILIINTPLYQNKISQLIQTYRPHTVITQQPPNYYSNAIDTLMVHEWHACNTDGDYILE